MVRPAHPVADEGTDDREAGAFHHPLDDMRDVADAVPGAGLVDPGRKCLLADVE